MTQLTKSQHIFESSLIQFNLLCCGQKCRPTNLF